MMEQSPLILFCKVKQEHWPLYFWNNFEWSDGGAVRTIYKPSTQPPPLHSHQEMNCSDIDSAFSAGTVH